jgi:hypothetical protein
MHSFVKDVFLNNVLFQVHFNEYYAPGGTRYFVYASSRVGNPCSFNMERENGVWKIIDAPKVEEHFIINEKKFSDAINDYLNGIRDQTG